MKKLTPAAVIIALLIGAACLVGLSNMANADRTKNVTNRTLPYNQPAGVGNLRPTSTSYSAPWVGFHASLYDTLGVLTQIGDGYAYANTMSGNRVFLKSVTLFGDDSAANTPTVFIRFFNASNRNTYLKLAKTYTAGEQSVTQWGNLDVAFPYDTTVVMQVYTHTANTSMDSLNVSATWEVDSKR